MLSILNQLCCPYRAKTTFPSFTQGVAIGLGYNGLSARRADSQIVLGDGKYSVFGRRVCEK